MNWDDLKIFRAVAATGSVRRAGAQLKVSHSTVSRRLDALEHDLGVRLFDRLPGGYQPTPAGAEILELTNDVSTAVHRIELRLVGQDNRLTGEIRVTAPDLLAYGILMPVLGRFNELYPDIVISLNTSYEIADLNKREADVAVRITEAPPGHLVGRRVATYAMAAYASPAYLEVHDLKQSAGLNWIGWSDEEPFPSWVRDSALPNVPTKGHYPNALVQVAAARAGLGIAMLPCFLGDTEPGLVRALPRLERQTYAVWVLTHPDLRNTARIRSFTRFLADAFAAQAELLEGRAPRQ
jgi:DNA-binding transcriptional LysR family regulator